MRSGVVHFKLFWNFMKTIFVFSILENKISTLYNSSDRKEKKYVKLFLIYNHKAYNQ